MDAPIHILIDMIHGLMGEAFVLAQLVITHMTVSEDVSVEAYMLQDLSL